MYEYLTVRSDSRHAGSVPTAVLVEHLDSMPGLQRTDLAFYAARDGRDWLHLTIALCDSAGNYAAPEGQVPQQANMVELICATADGAAAHEAALAVAVGIADLLGREVADEAGAVCHRSRTRREYAGGVPAAGAGSS
jgi:hypothetical protein